MSRLKICAFLAVLAACAASAAAAEDTTNLRAREGAAALLRGQFDKAIEAYDLALATPDIADFTKANIYSDRGLAKWRLKQTKDALADFNRSIELSPENPTVYNNRGNALMDLGHPEEAVKDFDRAISLSPNYGAAYNNRGNAHTALGQYDRAVQDFRKAVELMPTSPAPFNGRAKAHAALKRYHAAVRDYSRALSLNTRYEVAFRNRGEANLALDQFTEANDDLTQALDIQGDKADKELLLLRARAQAGLEKFKAAQADLDRAIELNPDYAEAYLERGILFSEQGKFEEAIEDYSRAIVIDADNAKAYAMRAVAKFEIEAAAPKPKPETVVIKIEPPQTVAPKAEPANGAETTASGEGGEAPVGPDGAGEAATADATTDDAATGNAPASGSAPGESVIAKSEVQTKVIVIPPPIPHPESLSDADKALTLAPDDPLTRRIRGDIHLAREEIPEAIADYRRALELDPYQSESREALVKLAQEVPPEPGAPLSESTSGWVITEKSPGRYVATNKRYSSVEAELEMYGAGQPQILEWSLAKGFSGIGLLRYYAGDLGDGAGLEYTAIVDLYGKRVVSIEPHSWGPAEAQWTWQEAAVVVTDPEGNANEVKLRKTRVARPASREDEGFFSSRRSRSGGGGGGAGGGMLDWLFR